MRLKTIVTYRASAQCPTHARTEIPIRDLVTVIDEPLERGGTNLGISPTETAMAALVACTNTIGHKCAHKLGVDLGDVSIDVACQLDRRGVILEEEIDVPFPKIVLDVICDTAASADDLNSVGVETAKYCAIAKLFTAAGTDLTVNWTKKA